MKKVFAGYLLDRRVVFCFRRDMRGGEKVNVSTALRQNKGMPILTELGVVEN